MQPVLGLIIPLRAEAARLLGRTGWRKSDGPYLLDRRNATGRLVCITSVMGTDPAYSAACRLAQNGASALGLIGVSGGLDPGLIPGEILVPDVVLAVEEGKAVCSYPPDAGLSTLIRSRLAAAGVRVCPGAMASVRRAVCTVREKKRIFETTRACAVDMESAAVARAAGQYALPFFVLRAVCDTADDSLPPWLVDAVQGPGPPGRLGVLAGLFWNPRAVADLFGLARRFHAAMRSLDRAWRLIDGPIREWRRD